MLELQYIKVIKSASKLYMQSFYETCIVAQCILRLLKIIILVNVSIRLINYFVSLYCSSFDL